MEKKKITYTDIKSFLGKCPEELIRYIEIQLAFARDIRSYQLEYSVSNKEFAKEFGVTISTVTRLRKGAVEITTREMAQLQTLRAQRIAEAKARVQIKE